MTKILLLFIFSNILMTFNAQNVENINNYKYVIINYKTYPNGNKDINQIGNYLYAELRNFGLIVLSENQENYPIDFIKNPCQALICSYDESFSSSAGNSVTITFLNCRDEMTYSITKKRFVASNTADYYQKTTKDALKQLKKLNYQFNEQRKLDASFFKADTKFKWILNKLKLIEN